MQAIVRDRYGSPEILKLVEVPVPVPKGDEILIRIHAVSLNRSDWETLTGSPLYARMGGLRKPRYRILGSDIAGVVEAVGKAHTTFREGDPVFGDILSRMGGFAEYVAVRGAAVARKPSGLSFDAASALPQAAMIALQAFRDKVPVGRGDRVLINGAGGGTGTFAIQLAKAAGAEVTGVDNAGKFDLMRSLGADHVIDHELTDFTRTGERYDVILDLVSHRSPRAYARALERGGACYLVGGSVASMLRAAAAGPILWRARGKRVGVLVVKPNRRDMEELGEMAVSGRLVPVIDATYTLAEVPAALTRLGEGRALGKMVIKLGDT